MHYNTLSETVSPVQVAEEMDALSLYHAFEHQRWRHTRGVRYSVALVLT